MNDHHSGSAPDNVRAFADIGLSDLEDVGGKNASLGEMVSNLSSLGVRVPDGFATTADAFRRFIGDTGLAEDISAKLKGLDTDDTRALAEVGKAIREEVANQEFPDDLEKDIRAAYDALVDGRDDVSFAVRSSATAEDLPDASFAGQQETFLNIKGIDGGAAGDPGGVRLALQRPRDRLPGAPRLRPRRRRALRRRAADGPLRRRRVRRDVHDGHRVRLRRRGVHHLVVRPRRGGRAGRRQPGRVLRLQARAA